MKKLFMILTLKHFVFLMLAGLFISFIQAFFFYNFGMFDSIFIPVFGFLIPSAIRAYIQVRSKLREEEMNRKIKEAAQKAVEAASNVTALFMFICMCSSII